MPDPTSAIPGDAAPNWVLRYGQWRVRRFEQRVEQTRNYLPGLRNRRSRRLLVVVLMVLLAIGIAGSVAAFWSIRPAAIPFTLGVLGAVIVLTVLRIITGSVADAPAEALDEYQLAQRNAARSLAYLVLIPAFCVIYAVAMVLAMRDWVAGPTVGALAWLLISLLLAATCLPDIVLTWWLPDDDDDLHHAQLDT